MNDAEERTQKADWGIEEPTEKQIGFIKSLKEQAEKKNINVSKINTEPETRGEASKAIEKLMALLDIAPKPFMAKRE